MITDEMLREAAAEYERYMLAHLPEITEPHVFSKKFERKMQKLISRARHPVLYHVKRYVAAVLLAIITLFGTVIALSPEARAAVIGWVRNTVGEFFQYTSSNTSDSVEQEYELSVLPEGYKQIGIIQKVDGAAYLFTDGSGNILQFSYTYGQKDDSFFIDAEDYEQHTCYVSEQPADIYISNKNDESNVIVWQSSNSDVIFCIFAKVDQVTLIDIAEGVQNKK